jgi:hypothetical protein
LPLVRFTKRIRLLAHQQSVFTRVTIYHESGVFDASYFKSVLEDQIKSAGAKATVEVHLMNAHTHRVRSVIDAASNYVSFEAYRQRVDGGRSDQHWQSAPAADDATAEVARVIVAYENIVEVVITPVEDAATARIGFVRE